MPRRVRFIVAAILFILVSWDAKSSLAAPCTATCQSSCEVDCTESAIRQAIEWAKPCTNETITLNCIPGTTIDMANTSPLGACNVCVTGSQRGKVCVTNADCGNTNCATGNFCHNTSTPCTQDSQCAGGICDSSNNGNALCLTGTGITFDGNGAVFRHTGIAFGACCSNNENDSPVADCRNGQGALFRVHGNSNTLKNFTFEYFPTGLQLWTGTHTVANVGSSEICDTAVGVPPPAVSSINPPTVTLSGSTFVGHTASAAGFTCYDDTGASGTCGTDKAVQINSGMWTVQNNLFKELSFPIRIQNGGLHVISGNRVLGSTTQNKVCQSVRISSDYATANQCVGGDNFKASCSVDSECPGSACGSTDVQLTNNAIAFCQFGVQADDRVEVDATGNTLTNNYQAAFYSKSGAPKVKGSGNTLIGNGFYASTLERGALLIETPGAAHYDFGGGDGTGAAVIGSLSTGGNAFCSRRGSGLPFPPGQPTPQPTTDLSDSFVSIGTIGVSSIGARSNCFDSTPPMLTSPTPGSGATPATPQPTPRFDSATSCATTKCGCPTSYEFYPDDFARYLDMGWGQMISGIQMPMHSLDSNPHAILTMQVSSCQGGSRRPCGNCTLSGPMANQNADSGDINDRRCSHNTALRCSTDSQCGTGTTKQCVGGIHDGALCLVTGCSSTCTSNADCPGGTAQGNTVPAGRCVDHGTCSYFFGAPTAVTNDVQLPMCLISRFTQPSNASSISGTVNVETGSWNGTMAVTHLLYSSEPLPNYPLYGQECPLCIDATQTLNTAGKHGLCSHGARDGLACDGNAVPPFGATSGYESLDCPPLPERLWSILPATLNTQTADVSRQVDSTSPVCKWPVGGRCFCDVCNNPALQPCFTNADCPQNPPGTSGKCGGAQCYGGTKAGAPCNQASQCPGGMCSNAANTQLNSCSDGVCPQTDVDEGICEQGAFAQHCGPTEIYRSCTNDSYCTAPGDVCQAFPQKCPFYPTNAAGFLSATAEGQVFPPIGGVSKPVISSLYCLGTASNVTEIMAGVPGLARFSLPGTLRERP